jgi:hypothetical protein
MKRSAAPDKRVTLLPETSPPGASTTLVIDPSPET